MSVLSWFKLSRFQVRCYFVAPAGGYGKMDSASSTRSDNAEITFGPVFRYKVRKARDVTVCPGNVVNSFEE